MNLQNWMKEIEKMSDAELKENISALNQLREWTAFWEEFEGASTLRDLLSQRSQLLDRENSINDFEMEVSDIGGIYLDSKANDGFAQKFRTPQGNCRAICAALKNLQDGDTLKVQIVRKER